MKNLLLLIVLFLISTGGYLQAQCPSEVMTSSNTNCLLIKWAPGEEPNNKPTQILGMTSTDTLQYHRDGQKDGYWIYFVQGPGGPSGCDTTGMTPFSGELNFEMFNGNAVFNCSFQGGEVLQNCPDDVLISASENCLIFMISDTFNSVLPDSVVLNTTTYYNQGYDFESPDTIIYLKNTMMACDTSNMNTILLTDTLYLGQKVCTYTNGLLPIAILAFEYKDVDEGVALSWKVNSEEPTRKLYLQKSYNGVDWMNVYEQNLENFTSGQTMDGHFMDVSIEQPRLYYRLFISGYSGELKYSNILPVTRLEKVVNTLFYQSQSRSIMIQAGQNFVGEMSLINAQGQNVMSQQIQIQKNTFQEINVRGHLTPGIYFVKFDNGLIPPTKIFIDN